MFNFIFSVTILLPIQADVVALKPWQGIVIGVKNHETVFTSLKSHAKILNGAIVKDQGHSNSAYRGTFRPDLTTIRDPVEFIRPYWSHDKLKDTGGGLIKCRIQVNEGYLAFTNTTNLIIIPYKDISKYEPSPWGQEQYYDSNHKLDPKTRGTPTTYIGSHNNSHCNPTELLFSGRKDQVQIKPDRQKEAPLGYIRNQYSTPEFTLFIDKLQYLLDAKYDVILEGKNRLMLFHVVGKELRRTYEPFPLVNKELIKDYPTPDPCFHSGKAPAELLGHHFNAYSYSNVISFILSDDGKLFQVKLDNNANTLTVDKLWQDSDQSIIGTLEYYHEDRKTVARYIFGYAKNHSDPDRYYLEMSDKPTKHFYKITVPMKGERDDAFREVYECSRSVFDKTEKHTIKNKYDPDNDDRRQNK